MSRSCAQWRGDIGAYIVGALDAHAREQVCRHLAACAGCRAEYDELVPVRDWLDLLPLTPDQPEYPSLNTGSRPRSRRRSWRRLPAAAAIPAAAAAAAAAIVIALLLRSGAPPVPTYRAVDSVTGVSGHAQLHETPTGTQIELTATGLPGNERCVLVAVTPRGTDIAGSWGATYGGSARMVGTTAFPAEQLTALRIESEGGILLLIIRV